MKKFNWRLGKYGTWADNAWIYHKGGILYCEYTDHMDINYREHLNFYAPNSKSRYIPAIRDIKRFAIERIVNDK